ncbi:hypothetical protein K7395_21330 [Streptomyces filamentosus]|uniref:Uncharacterized protein n=1 Tax=Streptomyces filamentosus TaxID=67294 RepID=A0ABY4V0K1_STRFL|nr:MULTISPECIES: hypothetical protein [Streptomyces]MYR79337.1 hypothetical protein [Streptomyces sp. SID5466]USC49085.1 hypothetical protein K7395_21330 [Streptomyces filamentosus]
MVVNSVASAATSVARDALSTPFPNTAARIPHRKGAVTARSWSDSGCRDDGTDGGVISFEDFLAAAGSVLAADASVN